MVVKWVKVGKVKRKVKILRSGKWVFMKGVRGRCPTCGRMRR